MLFISNIVIYLYQIHHIMIKQLLRKAKLHCKNANRDTKNIDVPWLNLSGLWLAEAGFDIGDEIDISVAKNTLTIRLAGKAPKRISTWDDIED
jgi:toxic protein SymE